MNCPQCGGALGCIDLGRYAGEYPDVVLNHCSDCRGVWYDRGELDLRDESVWTDVESLDLQEVADGAERSCPKCEVPMRAVSLVRLPDVVLDRCPSCAGFWLDAGELRALQRHAAHLDREKMSRAVEAPRPPDDEVAWIVTIL